MEGKPEDNDTEEQLTEGQAAEPKKPKSKASAVTSKIPDISDLASKFDLDKILGGIKSMISPEPSAAVSADPNDALGQKVEQLNALLNEMKEIHAKLAKDFAKANDLLIALFKDVEAIRAKKDE